MLDGRNILSEAWIRQSWMPRTVSPWSGQKYGYGWFVGEAAGHPVRFAWGHGGQMIYVVPDLNLTVVMTSASDATRDTGHIQALHAFLADGIVPAAEAGSADPAPAHGGRPAARGHERVLSRVAESGGRRRAAAPPGIAASPDERERPYDPRTTCPARSLGHRPRRPGPRVRHPPRLRGIEGAVVLSNIHAETLEDEGHKAFSLVCDARRHNEVSKMIEEIATRFGSLYMAFNNAGLGEPEGPITG